MNTLTYIELANEYIKEQKEEIKELFERETFSSDELKEIESNLENKHDESILRIEEIDEELEEIDTDEEFYIEQLNEEKDALDWLTDEITSLMSVIDCSSSADIYISNYYINEYIKEMLEDAYSSEINDLPSVLSDNLDWDAIINGCMYDYNEYEFEMDGVKYSFYYN